MCMATPARIKCKVKNAKCKVELEEGKIVDTSLIPDAKPGDWLLVHGDLAVNKISDEEAKNIFGLIKTCNHHHHH